MQNQLRGTVLTILSGVIFGASALFAMNIYENGSNAMTFSEHRMILGALFLGIAQRLIGGQSLKISARDLRHVAVCSLGFGLTPILLCSSYNYLPSGLCTTIHFVYPVLVLLVCLLFFREKLSVKKGICCLLCICGILCFCSADGAVQLRGVVLALLSGCTYTFYIVYLDKSGLTSLPPFLLGFWLNAVSAVLVTGITLLSGQQSFSLNAQAWGATVLYAGVLLSVGVIAFQNGVKYIGAQNGALLSTFEPMTSVLFGILFFHEKLTVRSAVGIVCILCSVVLLSVSPRKKPAEPERCV